LDAHDAPHWTRTVITTTTTSWLLSTTITSSQTWSHLNTTCFASSQAGLAKVEANLRTLESNSAATTTATNEHFKAAKIVLVLNDCRRSNLGQKNELICCQESATTANLVQCGCRDCFGSAFAIPLMRCSFCRIYIAHRRLAS
jgi:hypothetical protein